MHDNGKPSKPRETGHQTATQAISRRDFGPHAAAALTGILVLPRHVLGGSGNTAPSDKLNIAGVGVGGMGAEYLKGLAAENIVALCDVDSEKAAKTFNRYPDAKVYTDFRELLDKEKGIDAVVIGTPDHTHALVAMAAIQLRKHVYCAKPMTRTIHEVRTVVKAARDAKVATQMSVQSCASEKACETAEWIRAGAVGEVREVHVWTDRPVWPQGLARPDDTPPVPSTFAWDLWLGPAAERPYNPIYHPFRWRGWHDFGTGALGDMGCHTFHVIFQALHLEHPMRVQASYNFEMLPAYGTDADEDWMMSKKAKTPETYPMASIVTWDFPARGKQPPVSVQWYDGGLRPPRPRGWPDDKKFPPDGILFIGSKGVLFSKFTGGPSILSGPKQKGFTPPRPTLPRTKGHYVEFAEAAKGGPPANCNFDFGGLLTETALLGTIAQRTGKVLEWDAAAGRFTNDEGANSLIQPPYRSGWSL
ncbi:MAG: Gfo/Idh/MocA family oxidoreductase [Bryobacteraceae bacterium]